MKINFITFSNTTSNFSQERVKYECSLFELFDTITGYSEKDIDEDYMNKYGSHFNEKKGYGYWSWKPYFIKKKLSEMNDGDIVVYADCGCSFKHENKEKLLEWIEIAKSSVSGILSPCYGPYIEHDWTRGDLHKYIDETYNKNHVDIFDKAVQCGAGVLVICKNENSVTFVNAWNDVMSNHFELCTDATSSVPNHPSFRENRHDQSVFSMLGKIWGIEMITTSEGISGEKSPIVASRIRFDKHTWRLPTKK